MGSSLARRIGALGCAVLVPLVGAVASTAAPKPTAKRMPARLAAPNDVLWSSQWGIRAEGGTALWRWGRGSRKAVVAVLDTGVDAAHPELRRALVAGWNALAN